MASIYKSYTSVLKIASELKDDLATCKIREAKLRVALEHALQDFQALARGSSFQTVSGIIVEIQIALDQTKVQNIQ